MITAFHLRRDSFQKSAVLISYRPLLLRHDHHDCLKVDCLSQLDSPLPLVYVSNFHALITPAIQIVLNTLWLQTHNTWGHHCPCSTSHRHLEAARGLFKMAESDSSEDANVLVIPVDDSLSDGRKETWPLNHPKYKFEVVDDTKWRESLAEMWIENTGAREEGKFNFTGSYFEFLHASER
jgi:hypothetical protein